LAAELRLRETQERKEQVREIWERLNQVVSERGAAITSPPGHWPATLEVHPEIATTGKVVRAWLRPCEQGANHSHWPAADAVERLARAKTRAAA
jgi:hypothetical protein